ncbi:MAG: nitroreductase family protein [Candidatus Neomarinimicrobiota bacterium]
MERREKAEFSRPVTTIIQSRSSWRSYRSRPLEPELRDRIRGYLQGLTTGPFGHTTRYQLIEKDDPAVFDNTNLGTYGFIKNARNFIAGAVEIGVHHWEDYGYNLEKTILKMTELGLGTCWLGGTFRRSEFATLLKIRKNEVIPAVTPVGYGTNRRSIRDRIIRRGAKSRTRKPWEWLFFDARFAEPLSEAAAGEYAAALEMVRLAPSASNRQPWRVVKDGDNFHFCLKRSRNYSEMFKAADLQRVDMGIAMCHFELTVRDAGLSGEWIACPPEIDLPELVEYIITWQTKV